MDTNSRSLPTSPRRLKAHRLSNYARTAILMAGLTALFLALGDHLGGARGMLWAGVFVVGLNSLTFWFSDSIALKLNRAVPLEAGQLPWLQAMVASLAQRAGLPMPRLYVIPTNAPNAFATGRSPKHAAVAVTQGILRLLDERELRGVLAHELSHVKNRDTLISTIAATLAGIITQVARLAFWFGGGLLGGGGRSDDRRGSALSGLGMLIVAPIAAMLLQLAISRSREYGADASGAALSEDPDALADALEKLERGSEIIPYQASPATAPLFTVNPLTGGGLMALFSTHPATGKRVARLRAMAHPGLVR